MKFLSITIRTIIGFFVAIIGAGAFLEGGYLTCIGGVALALFTTVNPHKFKDRSNTSYWLVFIALAIMFLAFSYLDMNNGVAASV